MNNFNPNGIRVGDIIMVEQAWEDDAGGYHDEYAEVLAIDDHGLLTLDFIYRKDVNDFMQGATYEAKDYAPEKLVVDPADTLKDRILEIIRSEAALSESSEVGLFAGQVMQKIKAL